MHDGLEVFFAALVRNARLATFPRDRVPFCGQTKHQRRVLFLSLARLLSLFSFFFLPVLLDSELNRRFVLLLFLLLLFLGCLLVRIVYLHLASPDNLIRSCCRGPTSILRLPTFPSVFCSSRPAPIPIVRLHDFPRDREQGASEKQVSVKVVIKPSMCVSNFGTRPVATITPHHITPGIYI